jgi:hypothetical protein
LSVAVPAQRYYVPLVPIACLWAALGLSALVRPLLTAVQPHRSIPLAQHD